VHKLGLSSEVLVPRSGISRASLTSKPYGAYLHDLVWCSYLRQLLPSLTRRWSLGYVTASCIQLVRSRFARLSLSSLHQRNHFN
jgi:hypothetical protein